LKCGNLGRAVYSADVKQKAFTASPNPIMYFWPSADGKSGIVGNYWFVPYFPAGISSKSYADYRDMGGAIENCNGAGQDFGGKCLHRMNVGTLYPNGVKERAVKKIYQKGVTHNQNPQFDDTNFNVVVLNNGYADAVGMIQASVIVAALNKALATPSIWGGWPIPCAKWPCGS
jgi:hypothetical protein